MIPRDFDSLNDPVAASLLAYDEVLAGESDTDLPAPQPPCDTETTEYLEALRATVDRLELARLAHAASSRAASNDTSTRFGEKTRRSGVCERIGRFQIVRELGRGGCGIVFLAHDPKLSRRVALKVPRPEALVSAEMRERFLREAHVAALLDHPNVIAVHEVGEDGAVCYIASAYCEGPTLAQWLADRQEPVAVCEAAQLVAELAGAVEYAHAHGVLHRDIKPGNVLLARNVAPEADQRRRHGDGPGYLPKLSDFGLAKLLESDADVTRTGTLLGTPAYMAPEQAQGTHQQIGPQTDVYALGVLLYEVLTGRPPFRGAGEADTLRRVACDEPVPPRRLRRDVPRDLEAICLQCLEKNPLARYATAGDLAEDLRRFLRHEPTAARPIAPWQRLLKWTRRRPTVAALAAITATAILALAVGGWWSLLAVKQALRRSQETEHRIRRHLYASDMRLAHQAWQVGDVGQALDRLERHTPEIGDEDYRGFAWHYLSRLCHSERAVLEGHQGGVYCVSYSPDGNTLASASADATIRLWDVATGRALKTIKGCASEVNAVTFSPDGTMLASAADDGRVILWDLDTCQSRREFIAHREGSFVVRFSPDGRQLATCGRDEQVRLWDPATGQLTATLEGHTDWVQSIAFSPDGSTLAAASDDGTARIWDLATGMLRHTLTHDGGKCSAVTYSHDGLRLATASGHENVVRIWDVPTAQVVVDLSGHSDSVHGLCWSPDDARLVSCGQERVIVWNVGRGSIETTLKGHVGRVWCARFDATGEFIVSSGADRTIRIWNYRASQDVRELPTRESLALKLAYAPDGRVIACGHEDGTVSLIDPATGLCLGTLQGHSQLIGSLAISPDGQWLASGSHDETIALWDLRTRQLAAHLEGHRGLVQSLDFSPNGDALASSAGSDNTVIVWDLALRRPRQRFSFEGGESAVAFSPDGTRLAVISQNSVRIVSLEGGHHLLLSGHTSSVNGICFSPNGRLLATASADRKVKLWDTATGAEMHTLLGHQDRVFAAAFSPDSRELASFSEDGVIRVWEVNSGEEMLRFVHSHQALGDVAYSPDGRTLAAAARTTAANIRLWSSEPQAPRHAGIARHKPSSFDRRNNSAAPAVGPSSESVDWRRTTHFRRRRLPVLSSTIQDIAVSWDSQSLVTATRDQQIRVWDLSTRRLLSVLSWPRPQSREIRWLGIAHDNRRLAVGWALGNVSLWDLRDKTLTRTIPLGQESVDGAGAFDVDGSIIVARVASTELGNESTRVWRGDDGQMLGDVSGQVIPCSLDRGLVATQKDHVVTLWSVPGLEQRVSLEGHEGEVRHVAYDSEHDTAATIADDRTVRTWDLATGKRRHSWIALEDASKYATLDLSPDGTTLATAGGSPPIRLWDAQTGAPVATLVGPTKRIYRVIFSPDGRYLISGGFGDAGGEVFIWTPSPIR